MRSQIVKSLIMGGSFRQPKTPPQYLWVYLNFVDDPTTSITVTYHKVKEADTLKVEYREENTSTWFDSDVPDVRDFQNENIDICHCAISGLAPGTVYEFRLGDGVEIGSLSSIFKFKTMPASIGSGIRGAFGGDFQDGPARWQRMTDLVQAYKPSFFVVAGDWVNDDGNLQLSFRWVDFWRTMWFRMINSDGIMIPFVAGVGNHECKHQVNMSRFFFTDMFAFPNEGVHEFYGTIDIGDYMSLICLDSEIDTVANQNIYLQNTLSARQSVKYRVPYYHRPLFPSDRGSYTTFQSWFFTMFDDGMRAGFCGHDHTFKKSFEIVKDLSDERNARPKVGEETGFIEFGDGGLGTKYYTGQLHGEWYIDKSGLNFSHVSIVDFRNSEIEVNTINQNNKLVESTIIDTSI